MGRGRGSQAMKKASEVPAGLGTDTCSVQHCSENDLLLKGRGYKGRVGWGSRGEGSPLHTSVLGRDLNSNKTSLNLEIVRPSTVPQVCYGFAAQQQECLIYNR